MENNKVKMACYARHFLFFWLLSLSVFIIKGQSISKYYTSSIQGSAMLFYILPQSGFNNSETKSNFIYDITYLTTSEYATINFSYYDKMNRTIDSLVLVNLDYRYSCGTKKIFIETKKSKWHYRYSSQVLFTDLNAFYSALEKPKVILYTKEGAVELFIKEKKWKKKSKIIRKIFNLITYNK
ncbi:MAG: hypothetical protein PHI36_02725 [Bacteroidales bacterium]|nr:hypothetical protein [Bacteroidales bacterium]